MKKKILLSLMLLMVISLLGCQEQKINRVNNEAQVIDENVDLLQQFNDFEEKIKSLEGLEEKEAEIDKLIKMIGKGRFPLVQGENLIFIYQAPEDQTEISFVSELNDWQEIKMNHLANSSVYYLKLKAPKDARFDYKFKVGQTFKNDPLNSRIVPDDIFDWNSQVLMPDYQQDKYWIKDNKVESGEMVEEDLADLKLTIYLPNRYQKKNKHSVLYFLGGRDYLEYANAKETLENLIDQDEISGAIGVFIEAKDYKYDQDKLSELLKHEIIPYIEKEYLADTKEQQRVLIGFDLLAEVALNIAIKDQSLFSGIVAQSPLLTDKTAKVINKSQLQPDFRIYYDWGKFDDAQRTFRNLEFIHNLEELGYQYYFQVHSDGNGWGNWREHLGQGLKYVLDGKHSNQSSEKIRLAEEFGNAYPKYLDLEEETLIVEQLDFQTDIFFIEPSFIKLKDYKFKDFRLKADIQLLTERNLGILLTGGGKQYTIVFDTKNKRVDIYDQGKLVAKKSIKEQLPIKNISLQANAGQLVLLINNQLIDSIDFSAKESKYIVFSGQRGTRILLDKLYITEEFSD